jgi:hypothetical protein
MKKLFWGVGIYIILVLSACTPNYTVDLKVRNNTAEVLTIEYLSKKDNKKLSKTLKPGEQFAIAKFDKEGKDLGWNEAWKYKIISAKTATDIYSWKDYNIPGAWDLENSRYKTKGVLILESTDFLADIK